MTDTLTEVLAPAGSWETLRAAISGGADAVYFGGRSFNARRSAANFDDDELVRAVSYCHERGVKAYITFNTTVFEKELAACLDFIAVICRSGADAVLVQDLGLARLIRQAAPGLPLHASTQMSVHDPAGVKELEKMGFKRVVLARELSREEIREIADNTEMELEVFVHGALCMSMSGQCYFSAMLGGRSGNRGMCAQTCRLPFTAPGGTGHDLSLRDLSLCDYVNELRSLGVCSLKIEGRMKRPEYVAAASAAYKLAVTEGRCPPEQTEELKNVFSRSGFTQGYYLGERGSDMFGARGREDVLASQGALKTIRARYDGREYRRVPVDFYFAAKAGEPCSLRAADNDGNTAEAQGMTSEKALNRAIDENFVADKLGKTGGTYYYISSVNCELGNGLSLPAAEINSLRRQTLAELSQMRARPRPIDYSRPELAGTERRNDNKPQALRLRINNMNQLTPEALAFGAELIFVPLGEAAADTGKIRSLKSGGAKIGVELPRAIFGSRAEKRVLDDLAAVKAAGLSDALCGNLGALALAGEAGFTLHGAFGLNIANSAALAELEELGVKSSVLSFEESFANVRDLAARTDIPMGLIAYGRLPVMLVRCCPIKNGAGHVCGPDCASSITDRLGIEFPVRCRGGASEIFNSRPLWLCDRKAELKNSGADFAMLYFTTETPAQENCVLDAWKRGLPAQGDFTRGLYRNGAE